MCLYRVVCPESQLNFLVEEQDYNLQGTARTSLLKIITSSVSSRISTQNPRLDVCSSGVFSGVLLLTKGLRRVLKGYDHLETPSFVLVLGIS